MCRSTDIHGFQRIERDRLKIRAFYLRLSVASAHKPLPDSLTLVYLPRINGSLLEIDGSKIKPDSPGFVTLHRVVSAGETTGGGTGDVIFGSRERVSAGEGVRFEVYLGEEKALKGIFRKDEEEEWNMECRCALEEDMVAVEVTKAEVCVAVEGHVVMSEKVEMVVKRRKKARKGFLGLEEIPEEREVESESEGGCCCLCGEVERGSDGGDYEEESGDDKDGEEMEMEMEMEGVRWAVDVGIWVMCLGVGYLVSKASSKSLRRRRIF
ncbi:hypothetical protein L1049_022278 [Liquidambar formosana]|uniref:Uncharacterized protein n=1 Tax=Liquidambar formosana TaxID=63359 RepID=A0AAP0WQZ2_LIQFO